MGVPVVTWPQDRVVSRQTFAVLSIIGLPELIGSGRKDRIATAVHLAKDFQGLKTLRYTLRDRMKSSDLMDIHKFTRSLEHAFADLYARILETESKEQP